MTEPESARAEAAGPQTVLLLHGLAGDGSAWAGLERALRRVGRRVLAPDLPGHGANPAEAATPEDLVAAAVALARPLPGRLHLVGHSMGAWVAARTAFALGGQAEALTLIAPAGAGDAIDTDFVRSIAAGQLSVTELRALMPLLGTVAAALPEPVLEAMARQLAKGRLARLAEGLAGPEGQRIDILATLAALPPQMRITALFGRHDRIVPVRQALNMPAGVTVHVLPTGHMPHWDAPAEVLALLLD